jgi:hypothetical protein
LRESGVPSRTEDPEGYRRYEDHVLLLYDRRDDALGPQYYRRSSAEGPGPWQLTPECALRADYLREQSGIPAEGGIPEGQEDEMIIAPLDGYNAEVMFEEPGEETEEDAPHPPADPEILDRYQNAFEEERLAIQNQTVYSQGGPSVEITEEMREGLIEARRKKDKEARRNQRARAKTYTDEARRNHSINELKRMYERARLLEPWSDSDSSDSDSSDGDISDGDEEPIEEIASPGELLTPQADGNEDGESSSGESDHEDGSDGDMDEDASDSEDESEEEEESAEEEAGPRRSARIAAQNANHAEVLLLLRLRDSVQNMW